MTKIWLSESLLETFSRYGYRARSKLEILDELLPKKSEMEILKKSLDGLTSTEHMF